MSTRDALYAGAMLLVLAVATGILMWGILMWASIQRMKDRKRLYGLPRCRGCQRIWDAHTVTGACPDGSGRYYED